MKEHSERVPGKNFRSFCGRPLFQWILDALLSVDAIESVVINTDATERLSALGVDRVPRVQLRERRADLCGDFVSMNLIIEDDVAAVRADAYVMTHATNPLLSGVTIGRAIEAYLRGLARGEADSLFTVNRFQSRFYTAGGRPLNHDPARLVRTQDLEPIFEENSNLYVFSAGSFDATHARIGRRPLMFDTPRAESLDIDDQEGWELAETVGRERLAAALPQAVS
jgi:CMP-N-acetylneuraminic acid synthetase